MEKKRNVISFLNMKGGVCKTTLCKEIALYLSEMKRKRILVIDIDPQSNCTQSFFERYEVLGNKEDELITSRNDLPSIENIFSPSRGNLEETKLEKTIYKLSDTLHLVPGELRAVFMERETANGVSEQRLYNFIDDNDLKDKYDYIFIDCPPTYSFYTTAAFLASDLYLVPVVPDAYSLLGVNLLEEVVSHARDAYRANFQYTPLDNLGIIFTKIPTNIRVGFKNNMEQIKEALQNSDIYVFNNYYIESQKIVTSRLSKFILDREDTNLLNNLKAICQEFEAEVEKYNG